MPGRQKAGPVKGVMDVDMESLRDFVTVCQEKKMTRAAEKLFMSKQTLSAVVKKLEREMNTVFLVRGSFGVELTPEGQCFFEYAQQMLALWEQCRGAVCRVRQERQHQLSVGFAYMSWNLWTEEVREGFERANPNVELTASYSLSKDLLRQLDEGNCDVIITCMQRDRYAQYDVIPLCSAQISVMMAQKDPLAQKETLTPYDLRARKILYPDSGAEFLRRFVYFMEEIGVPVESELVPAGNLLGDLKAVRERGALLFTNEVYRSVIPQIEGYTSRTLRFQGDGRMPRIVICALMQPSPQHSAAALRFLAFFKEELRQRFGGGPV